MNKFITIITNNYKKIIKDDHSLVKNRVIKNMLFFKEIKNEIRKGTISNDDFKTFSELIKFILVKPKMYNRLKQLLIDELVLNNGITKNDLSSFFEELEKNGFNSFDSISKNDKIKSLLNGKLKHIYSIKFSNNHNTITDHILNINNNKICINSGILNMLEYFNSCAFMPFDVFMNMNDDQTIFNVYKTLPNSNLHNIYLLSSKYSETIESKNIQLLLKIASITINSLNELFNKKKNVTLDLVVYGIDAKKKLPNNQNEIINETNVNSGDTTMGFIFPNPSIRLYRSEELIKVLIHETIHCSQMDSQFGGSPPHIFKLFNIKMNSNSLLFNETITETIAEFLNCVLYSIIHKKDIHAISKNIKSFQISFIN